jgi:heat shock protein HslJ
MTVPRAPRAALAAMFALLALLAPVGSAVGAPAPSPSLTALRNATYAGIYDKPVTLRNGLYQGPPASAGGTSRPRVELVRGGVVHGHLLGPASADAAVLLVESSGGSGSVIYLAIMTAKGARATNVATARVGDRVQVRDMRLEPGSIALDLVAHAPQDPMCCPTLKVTRSWRCRKDSLLVEATQEDGRISARDLEGPVWRLELLDRNQPVPRGVAVTASFAGGTIQGSSGCNRYSAAVEGADASERIGFGPVASTRMACPDPVGSFEVRYLAALDGAQAFGFLVGKLSLSYRIGERTGVMLFSPDSTVAAR